MSANAQTTTPFETVFDACKKACEALDGGFASGEQLLAVSKTLRDAAPIPLTVKQTKAEVNRSFSWKIKTIGYQSKREREYKCNDSVRKGLPFRKEKVSSDERYKIIVSITNKSKRDGSFALILF